MSKTKERNILLVYQDQSTFVKHDLKILAKYYHVKGYYSKSIKKIFPFLWEHFKLILYILINFKKIDIIYTWFGDYHAFSAGIMAKLFKIPHLIVIGGNDAVSIPSIGYGVFSKNNFRSKLVKIAYKMARALLVVDASLIASKNTYAGDNNLVGLDNIAPGLKNKCIVIPTGYEASNWNCKGINKKDQVLSVAIIDSTKRAVLKGFDLFIDLARKLPQYQFVFIGMIKDSTSIEYNTISNLKVIEKVEQQDLKKYYCESKVYAQLSLSEGLPNSLCEAMLCSCIPVGSAVNGIPNCIGNTGFILKKKNSAEAIELIKSAMNSNNDFATNARDRIMQLYPANKREFELKKLIDSL